MCSLPAISSGPVAGGAGREAESLLKSYSAAQQAAQASPAPSPMGPPGIPRGAPLALLYVPILASGLAESVCSCRVWLPSCGCAWYTTRMPSWDLAKFQADHLIVL